MRLFKLHLLFGFVLFTLLGCDKKDDLPSLEYNKWIEEVDNPIIITGIEKEVLDPTRCAVKVSFEFDRLALEAEWTQVEAVWFQIRHVGPTLRPSYVVEVNVDNIGVGAAIPKSAYTLSNYEIAHQILFTNGRKTKAVGNIRFTTPSY
jgi:hypothetical protein